MITAYFLETTGIIWYVPCLLECLVFFFLIKPLGSKNPFGWKDAAAAIALIAYQMLITYLHQQFYLDFVLCLAGYFVYLTYEKCSSRQQNLYVSCVFLLCVEAGKIVALDLLMQPIVGALSQWSLLAVTLLNFGLTFAVLSIVAFIASRWLFDSGAENLSWTQCVSILLPIIPFMFLRSRSYAYENPDQPLYQDMVLILLMLIGSIIVIIVVNAANLSSVVKKADLLQMEALLNEQHQHYAMKKSAVDAVRRQYHDLKHYLGTLEESRDIRQVRAFVEGMSQTISPFEAFVETGNEAVDIILADKAGLCQRERIRLVPYVDASRLNFMSSFELCALFGNALDNAIEATIPLDDESLREISLKVSYDHDLMVMRLANRYAGDLPKKDGRLATTKPNSERHGFGMESIDAIARKHGGAMSFDAEGGTFTLNVVIPVPR